MKRKPKLMVGISPQSYRKIVRDEIRRNVRKQLAGFVYEEVHSHVREYIQELVIDIFGANDVQEHIKRIIKSNKSAIISAFKTSASHMAMDKTKSIIDEVAVSKLICGYTKAISKHINADDFEFRESLQNYVRSAVQPVFTEVLKGQIMQFTYQVLDRLAAENKITVMEK